MRNYTSQRDGFTFWQVALVLATLGLLAMILIPVFGRPRPTGKRSSCQSNLKQIGLGFKQYVQDYDEKYPLIAGDAKVTRLKNEVSTFGWADALQPYMKSTQIFQCSTETTPANTDPTSRGYTDYWFNARMAGAEERYLHEQALTVALGDGDSSDARSHLWGIPRNWMGNPASPLYRHLDGANYAFADGHVKWFRNDSWKDSLDMENGRGTFRLQPKD